MTALPVVSASEAPTGPGPAGAPIGAGPADAGRSEPLSGPAASPWLEAVAVRHVYRRREALAGVDLAVRRGECVALLGPNGSGKTTLMKALIGLIRPTAGRTLCAGRPVAALGARIMARRAAYVPQAHRETFAFTAEEVVLLGRLPYRSFFSPFTAEDRRLAAQALDRLGAGRLLHAPYTAMSGGERQLVLIARALVQEAPALIMDEPTNGLDYGHQIRLLRRVRDLAAGGLAILFSTHHPEHALLAADRAVLMRAGRIIADGPAAAVLTEENLEALYDAPVRLVELPDGRRVCVPCFPDRPGPPAEAEKTAVPTPPLATASAPSSPVIPHWRNDT